jgi:Nif-specific regulatory protein
MAHGDFSNVNAPVIARAATPPALRAAPRAVSDIALTGVYEISKILTAPQRLETMLAGVVTVLSSFLDMRHGIIALLDDDGIPGIVVGAGWTEESSGRYRRHLPEKAIDQIVATGVPLVVQSVAEHALFAGTTLAAQATAGAPVAFIGVPMRNNRRVIGTLTIDRVMDGAPGFRVDADLRFLTMVANLIGQTVELHRVVASDRDRLICESNRLQKQLSDLKPDTPHGARAAGSFKGIVGDSPAIRQVMDKIAIVARTNAPVLLRGESGTGKELFAKAIHDGSPRAARTFVKVNCAALPESVLESELFGHEKGAFTGAINARKGRFEMADGGTLFLDEIGEISASFQAKLLRVLQEGEFDRVGGSKPVKVDVRIITATNRHLEDAVRKGEFRADLYYRISVVPLILPPLRARKGDIPMLAREFLRRFNAENDRKLTIGRTGLDTLSGCYFPGNVRELENCIRRTATLACGNEIGARDFACAQDQCLSSTLWKTDHAEPAGRAIGGLAPLPIALVPFVPAPVAPAPVMPAVARAATPDEDIDTAPRAASGCACAAGGATGITSCPPSGGCPSAGGRSERDRLVDAMEKCGWVQAKAARLMNLTARQIGYALKKHGIEVQRL